MKLCMLTLSVLMVVSTTVPAHLAAVTVTEPFNYTAGSNLNGLNGGSGWSGAWTTTAPFSISSGSLAYPAAQFGGPSTGNKVGVGNVFPGEPMRNLSVAGDSAGAGSGPLGGITLWASVLVNPITIHTANSGDGIFFAIDGTATGGFDGFTAGFRSNTQTWLLGSPFYSNEALSSKPVSAGSVVKLVVRLDFTGNTNPDRVSLYVNPGLTLPASPDAMLQTTDIGDLAFVMIQNLRVTGDWDEIMISDVAPFDTATVPEPGTLAMFALGLAGLGVVIGRRATAKT